MTFYYRESLSGPPSTVDTKTGFTERSVSFIVMASNAFRFSNLSTSKPWLSAVDESFPDLTAIYVGPEQPAAYLLPKPTSIVWIPAYTDGISLCRPATTQSWSRWPTRYSACIRMRIRSCQTNWNATLFLADETHLVRSQHRRQLF